MFGTLSPKLSFLFLSRVGVRSVGILATGSFQPTGLSENGGSSRLLTDKDLKEVVLMIYIRPWTLCLSGGHDSSHQPRNKSATLFPVIHDPGFAPAVLLEKLNNMFLLPVSRDTFNNENLRSHFCGALSSLQDSEIRAATSSLL